MPPMDMISDVSGCGLEKFDHELQPSIVSYRELEKGKEYLSNSFEGTICLVVFVDIPLAH